MDLDLSSASSASSGSLAPGFRFHPTDEELVSYYLKRKVCGKPFRFDAISDVDVYKAEPWDLPGRSKLKTRDLEWYFFSALDKKYGNGSRTNRATERGYWKTTGKDRAVLHRAQTVGMKKTLVYHSGRAPRGERTNWVMHEYRLVDESLEKSGIFQDVFVLCRIFQKSGSGPKNGEQYGAPFVEEEWENDDLVMVPGGEARGEEAAEYDAFLDAAEYDAFLDANDIDQILGADIPSGDAPLPFSYSYGDNSTNADDPLDFIDDAKKLLLSMGGAPDQPDDENFLDFPVQNYVDAIPVKQEYFGESSNSANFDPDTFFDEPFFDVSNNQFAEGAYLDIDDDVSQYLAAFGASDMMGSEDLFSNQSCLTLENLNGGAQQDSIGSQQLFQGLDNYVESSSKTEVGKLGSDTQHPLTKQANRKLGSLPAPPAFASEFPTKEAALLLSSMSQSSSPAHITAGMIQIRDMTPSGNRPHWSFGKNANVNIFLSFGPPPNGLNPAMVGLAALRCWLYMLFLWVLLLSVSCRFGTYFYTGNAA